jgi:hypothetical protein
VQKSKQFAARLTKRQRGFAIQKRKKKMIGHAQRPRF